MDVQPRALIPLARPKACFTSSTAVRVISQKTSACVTTLRRRGAPVSVPLPVRRVRASARTNGSVPNGVDREESLAASNGVDLFPSTGSSAGPNNSTSVAGTNGIANNTSIDDVGGGVHPSWLLYNNDDMCVVCQGEGDTLCAYCFGDGKITIGPSAERDTVICPECNGTGREQCVRCEGSGKRPKTRWDPIREEHTVNPTNADIRKAKSKSEVNRIMNEQNQEELPQDVVASSSNSLEGANA